DSGFGQAKLYTTYGVATGDQFGASVTYIGDVNHDGIDDFAVGAPSYDQPFNNAGMVRIHSGANGAIIRVHTGTAAGQYLGAVLDGGRDINADGTPDYIIGAPSANNGDGLVRLYSGSTGTQLFVFRGQTGQKNRVGESVALIDDWDGDGNPDFAFGAPWYGDLLKPKKGRLYILSGVGYGLLFGSVGTASYNNLGSALASVGDLDLDGKSDLLVGAPGKAAGEAYIYKGGTGSKLFTYYGSINGGLFGSAVSPVGDVNQDGYPDVVIGAYKDNDDGFKSGRVTVFSGIDASILVRHTGGLPKFEFGKSIRGGMDVDSDGISDYIVGAPAASDNTLFGKAVVFSGATGKALHTFKGQEPDDYFGQSVDLRGMVNADSYADIIVGALEGSDATLPDTGSVSVFNGPHPSTFAAWMVPGILNKN
ncbi:MAG: FG-GAP repeat protein, partial [Bdellovibrionales bacterium]|nr:FG-GAP repeat protein [Bdellovibrionales bacterium]